MMKSLLVEGWRTSSHSYALVNQHQLLHLARDPRLSLSHVDVPFFRPHWAGIDAGFSAESRNILAGLSSARPRYADAIYRISWPLRIHPGAAKRVFVFGTCEFQLFREGAFVGPDGSAAGVDLAAVEIVTPSVWAKRGFLASGFASDRVHVIPHGVDPVTFAPKTPEEKRQLRAAFGIPEEAFVFLNVSAGTWNKGLGPLVAAFARHRRHDPRALLFLKGAEALYGQVVQHALPEAEKLCPGVSEPANLAALRYVPANLSQAQLAGLYQMSDAYIAPYRAEGFNLPALEALACGIPVIVTSGGATDDFCPEEICPRVRAIPVAASAGHYLEPDVDSIAQCMRRVTEETALRERAAETGPRWAAEHYAWSTVAARLADLLTAERSTSAVKPAGHPEQIGSSATANI
jgi:glycosyltransferase involved in cell wall biosynthesis